MSGFALLRAGALVLLAALFLMGDGSGLEVAHARLDLGEGWQENPVARRAFAASAAPAIVVRRATSVPGMVELDALGGIARRAPLLATLPELDAGLRVEAPQAPHAERAAALSFGVRGESGDTILVRLRDAAGVADSVRVEVPATGRAEGVFRLRPSRPGWQEWRVEGAGAAATAGAWVRDAEPPRVLVAAGPPTWESRFLLRALEESGAAIDAALPLGRGLQAGAAGPAVRLSAAALDGYDVVVVLPGAELSGDARSALERYVAGGGGVLAVGRADLWTALGLALGASEEQEVDAGAIAWQLPADLAPLPAAEVRPRARPLDGPGAGAHTAAHAEGQPLLVLRAHGLGRAAGSGFLDTWLWRMEAGRTAEHREFWRSLVDWLAGEGGELPRVHLVETRGPTGVPAAVELFGATDAAVPRVALGRPDGTLERLVPAPDGLRDGVWRAAFLPGREGVYRLRIEDEVAPRAAFRAVAGDAPVADGAARLTLLAHASGGAVVPADSVGRWLDVRYAGVEDATGARWLRWLLLVTLASFVLVEWTGRRLSGRR